jgi:hypothetical protein
MGHKHMPMGKPSYDVLGPELGPLYATINAIIPRRLFAIKKVRNRDDVDVYVLTVNGENAVDFSFEEPKGVFPSDELITELMLRWG